jgi:hypothetical protein
MKIRGIENLTNDQINEELKRGARFVIFQYCVSILVMSFKRNSDIYFIPGGAGTAGKSAPWSGLSFVLGWWGIPWGPIWTIATIAKNMGGGVDVTSEILASMNAAPAVPAAAARSPN